jgi:hypothetical protein
MLAVSARRRGRCLAISSLGIVIVLVVGSANWPGSMGAAAEHAAASAAADIKTYQYWSTVGSTGVVDETDVGLVKFSGPAALFRSTAPAAARAVLRYNVTANPNLDQIGSGFIGARFRDNGEAGRVLIKLKQAPYNSNETTTLLTLDSNDYASNNAYQYRNVFSDPGDLNLDFEANFYFIEVTLTRSSGEGKPALRGMFVGK